MRVLSQQNKRKSRALEELLPKRRGATLVTLAEAQANPQEFLGRDVRLDPDGDLIINARDDLQRVNFYANLEQAIKLRLATALGSLALHPEYGSRLHELIGISPDIDTLQLAKMHVRDAMLQEPRVQSITTLTAKFRDNQRNVIDIQLQVQPVANLQQLNVVYSVFVGGE